MGLFGTYGIRGRMDFLTPEFTARMCAAFGRVYGKRVALGRDSRVTGELLSFAAKAGFMGAGCDVVDLGVVPSPTIEFYVKEEKMDAGIAITASHNPPEWNALKFMGKEGIGVSREEGEKVEQEFRKAGMIDWKKIGRSYVDGSASRRHIDAIKKKVKVDKIAKERLSLVVDCGNGAAFYEAPQLLKEIGCKVVSLNAQPDGFFPGRDSEPIRENLAVLIASVKKLGADVGMAFDADGDRIAFVDEKGEYIVGDRTFALCTKIVLKKRKGTVVTTVATSNAIKDVAKKHGGKVEYVKVGGPYISRRVKETKAVIGGEEVGGIVWPELHWGKDGIMSAAKVIEEMALSGKTLSALLKTIPVYYNSKTKVECTGDKNAVLRHVERNASEGKVSLIDGVRVDFGDAWVIVRASGTEDYMRIFAEAKNRGKAEALMEKYKRFVEEAV